MVEFLVVACLLGVGLLGLGALQLGVARGLGQAWTRLAAVTLAGNALEPVRSPLEPEADPERFDRNGQPAQGASGCFTVTVRRLPPADPAEPADLAEPAGLAVVRATVTWADPVPGRVSLARLVRR
jgi:Tfp pilus assembly protein PilV